MTVSLDCRVAQELHAELTKTKTLELEVSTADMVGSQV
jgi:hypothetical protein